MSKVWFSSLYRVFDALKIFLNLTLSLQNTSLLHSAQERSSVAAFTLRLALTVFIEKKDWR